MWAKNPGRPQQGLLLSVPKCLGSPQGTLEQLGPGIRRLSLLSESSSLKCLTPIRLGSAWTAERNTSMWPPHVACTPSIRLGPKSVTDFCKRTCQEQAFEMRRKARDLCWPRCTNQRASSPTHSLAYKQVPRASQIQGERNSISPFGGWVVWLHYRKAFGVQGTVAVIFQTYNPW